MGTSSNRVFKIIAAFSFLLITAALLIIHGSPATGYEISFYSSISPLVWIFLILSIIGGLTILVQQAFAKDNHGQRWLIGLMVLILAYLTISIIPPLRGYVIYGRGDILSHVGWVQDTISNGQINTNNFYPITHIIIAQIAQVCNIEYLPVMNYLPALFAVLYVLSICLLSKAVLPDRGQILISSACGALLVTWGCIALATRYGAIPTSLSTMTVPLIIYVYFKAAQRRSVPFSVLLCLLLVYFPFFHPLCAALLVVFFIVIEISKVLLWRIFNSKKLHVHNIRTTYTTGFNFGPTIIIFAVLFMWSVAYTFFIARVHNLAEWLSGETTIGKGELMMNRLAKVDLSEYGIAEIFFKLYGDIFIFGVLALLAIILLYRRYHIVKDEKIWMLIALAGCFGISGLAFLVLLAPNVVSPMRVLGFMSICSTVLAGFVLYELFKGRGRYQSVVVAVLALVATIGIFHSYNSPYTYTPNDQVTQMSMHGYSWAFSHDDPKVSFMPFAGSPIIRYSAAVLGNSAALARARIPLSDVVPDHFNYGLYQAFGASLLKDKYMVIDQAGVLAYTQLWTELDRFKKGDFIRLAMDSTVVKLYSNSQVETYRVYAIKE